MNSMDFTREWLLLPSPGAGDLQLLAELGVAREAIHRAGGLAVARISTVGRVWMSEPNGTPAFILSIWNDTTPSIYCGVENPVLIDMIAWRPDDPTRWWYRLGEVDVALGAEHLDLAHVEHWPITLARSPLDWLQGNCRGACLLGYCEAAWTAEQFAEDQASLGVWWKGAA